MTGRSSKYTFYIMFDHGHHERSKQHNAMYIPRDGKQLQVPGPSVSKRLHTTPGPPKLRNVSVPHREEAPGLKMQIAGKGIKSGVTGHSGKTVRSKHTVGGGISPANKTLMATCKTRHDILFRIICG